MKGAIFYHSLKQWALKGIHENYEGGSEEFKNGRKSVFVALNNLFFNFEKEMKNSKKTNTQG